MSTFRHAEPTDPPLLKNLFNHGIGSWAVGDRCNVLTAIGIGSYDLVRSPIDGKPRVARVEQLVGRVCENGTDHELSPARAQVSWSDGMRQMVEVAALRRPI